MLALTPPTADYSLRSIVTRTSSPPRRAVSSATSPSRLSTGDVLLTGGKNLTGGVTTYRNVSQSCSP
jgi:hypothetical protein